MEDNSMNVNGEFAGTTAAGDSFTSRDGLMMGIGFGTGIIGAFVAPWIYKTAKGLFSSDK